MNNNFNKDLRYPVRDSAGLVKRCEENPILTAKDIPFSCNSVFNVAATTYEGEIVLILRIENRVGFSCLGLARSVDGVHFNVESQPILLPATQPPFDFYEKYGISDPRITKIEDTYYLTYAGYNELGVYPIVARTYDFQSFERISVIAEPDNRNVVLFPEKINSKYVRLDRPMGKINDNYGIWLAESPDLVHWGNYKVLMKPRAVHWDSMKIGPGAPPIKTEKGWLEIYHGVGRHASGVIYRLGCVLLDLEDPSKVLGRGMSYILGPEETYERVGDVDNVVFTNGAILDKDTGRLSIYYGCADQSVCLAHAALDELIRMCLDNRVGDFLSQAEKR